MSKGTVELIQELAAARVAAAAADKQMKEDAAAELVEVLCEARHARFRAFIRLANELFAGRMLSAASMRSWSSGENTGHMFTFTFAPTEKRTAAHISLKTHGQDLYVQYAGLLGRHCEILTDELAYVRIMDRVADMVASGREMGGPITSAGDLKMYAAPDKNSTTICLRR